jgi:hypothetical protein
MRNRIISIVAFGVLTLLWLAFAAALVFNRELLDTVWQSFRSWPLVLQFVVGLLVLPVFAGLWIWESSWPVLLRLVLVAGLAWATVYVFFPGKQSHPADASAVTS